tara:strand:- start:3704 stop:4090 length:387 start_codon:yes stop_codon:yes gene_type:complete
MIQTLRDELLTSAFIDRVEPYLRDPVSVPVVIYEVASDDREQDLDGTSRLRRASVDFRCLEETYEAADDLAQRVTDVLNGYNSGDGSVIVGALATSFERTFDLAVESSNQLLYISTVTCTIWWQEGAS